MDDGVVESHLPQPAVNPPSGLSQERARALAQEAGFAEAALLALPYAHEKRDGARFAEWLDAGRAGSMHYLERKNEEGHLLRTRPQIPFPWVRSVLVFLTNYHSNQPRSTDAVAQEKAWIARYAWSGKPSPNGGVRPSDYHKVLLKRVKDVEVRLHEELGAFEARAFVDTGPLVERSLAVAAGLGWTGKNTCLIHPKLGSYSFLSVLVTSLDVEEKMPTALPDRCGSCRRCLEACPTGALIAPQQMDATRCIAYLTIEHRGPIAPELYKPIGRNVFGCDICQDVCPWNRKSPFALDEELAPRPELVNPALEWLASLDEAAFEAEFNGSPVRRAGFLGLQRNVAIAIGNSGLSRFAPRLKQWAESADEGLRAAARWALGKLEDQ
jgi:epoxyqueuosine reductase